MQRKKIIILGLLVLLFILASGYKSYRAFKDPRYQLKEDTAAFWTEAAVHYRWAKMVADGKEIPQWDQAIQYPEGIHPFKDETPIMELVSGTLYRWLHLKIPFHQYIVIFNATFSTLTIFPLFGVAYLLCGNIILSFFCSILFAFSLANISSPLTGSFIRENFALTFIYSHFFFLFLALKKQNVKWAIGSGIFVYLALLSWHLAQFYFAILIGFMALAYLWDPKRDKNKISFVIVLTFLLIGGATIPTLLKGGYLLSFGSLLSLSLILAILLFPSKWKNNFLRIGFLMVGAVLCFVPYLLQSSHFQEFSHVYQFLVTKILYLGQKPASPEALSYEAKVMWMSSFVTPSLKTVWSFFNLTPFLAIPGFCLAIYGFWKRKIKIYEVMLLYFCCAFIFLYWLILRMDCFLVYFLCAIIPFNSVLTDKKKIYTIVFGIILGLGVIFNLYKSHISRVRQVMPPLKSIYDTLYRIKILTKPDDPILAPFPFSPSIAAFTGRPIIVHSKFENAKVREKVKEMNETFFKDEETFFAYCKKYGARYLVIDVAAFLDLSSEGMRYRTNNMWASRNSAIYKLHFAPEKLKHFKLLTSNEDYRIYRVLKPGESRIIRVPTQPGVYYIKNFNPKQLQLID